MSLPRSPTPPNASATTPAWLPSPVIMISRIASTSSGTPRNTTSTVRAALRTAGLGATLRAARDPTTNASTTDSSAAANATWIVTSSASANSPNVCDPVLGGQKLWKVGPTYSHVIWPRSMSAMR